MKKLISILSLSLMSLSLFADSAPALKNLELGTFKGKDFFSQCEMKIEETREGKIIASFKKGDEAFKSKALSPDLKIMVSSNKQVWFDFAVDGATHVVLNLNNEFELKPVSFHVLQGRDTKIFGCKNLK